MATALGTFGEPELRYSRGAMWFHWTIAALILANIVLGLFHEDFAKDTRATMMFAHKSIGLTVLALSLARLAWRLTHRPPPFDPALRRWEAALAKSVHWLFYFLMIAMPLTGWLLTSSGGRTTSWFGLFDIGPLPIGKGTRGLWHELHEMFGWSLIVLVLLHVAGALKHHLEGHRHVIGRMGPWLYRRA